MMNKDGGPAFPQVGIKGFQDGMTLEDYFAGQALIGLIAHQGDQYWMSPPRLAELAYTYANAMLDCRRPVVEDDPLLPFEPEGVDIIGMNH